MNTKQILKCSLSKRALRVILNEAGVVALTDKDGMLEQLLSLIHKGCPRQREGILLEGPGFDWPAGSHS